MLAVLFLTVAMLPAAQDPGTGAPPDAQQPSVPPDAQQPMTPPQDPAAAPSMAPGTAGGAQAFIDAGLAHFKKRRFARAEAEFRKAVEADPSSAAAHFYLGYAQYKQVEPRRPFHPGKQEAAAEFAKAYELDPTFKPVWHMNR
jgi:TolA-binding protein